MKHAFKLGDLVGWHSEFGPASGTVIKVHTVDTNFKGHMHRCTETEPQNQIQSNKTDHIAMHKGRALHKLQ